MNNMIKKLFRQKKEVKKKPEKRVKTEPKALESYLMDAIDAFENRDFITALKLFTVLTSAYPDHALGNLLLGRTYIELKRYEDGINYLFKHLKIQPKSIEALIYMGLTYYECGELDQAEERFKEALAIKDNNKLVLENLALTQFAAGKLEDAAADLIKLHNEDPDNQDVSQMLVLVLGRMGKWELAKGYADNLEATSPDN